VKFYLKMIISICVVYLRKGMPLKRISELQQVNNAVLFLASDEAAYVNGIELEVDGGMSRYSLEHNVKMHLL